MQATIQPDDIIGLMTQWAIKREQSIYSHWTIPGGWEGWARPELHELFYNSWDSKPEQHVYDNPKLKVDLLLQPHGPSAGCRRQIIELKCQSIGQDAGAGIKSLGQRLHKDLCKVSKLKSFNPQFLPAVVWCIGITGQKEAADAAQNWDYGGFKVNRTDVPNTDISFVWYAFTAYSGN